MRYDTLTEVAGLHHTHDIDQNIIYSSMQLALSTYEYIVQIYNSNNKKRHLIEFKRALLKLCIKNKLIICDNAVI